MALVKHGQAGGLGPWVLPPVLGSISMENTCGVLPTAAGATHIPPRASWPGSGAEGLTVVGAAGHHMGSEAPTMHHFTAGPKALHLFQSVEVGLPLLVRSAQDRVPGAPTDAEAGQLGTSS